MTYEQWQSVKEECHNAKMVVFCAMSKAAQEAIAEVGRSGGIIELFNMYGVWERKFTTETFPGRLYRVSPSWPGPAKPEPVVEYEDVPVWNNNKRLGYGGLYLDAVRSDFRFAGYVMPDGKLRPRLTFDSQPDGTYRLRVPKAVRLVKDVAK